MGRKLSVHSETGRLRRVVVHTPGAEVEAMRPSRAEEDLYNDIIPLDIVRTEHAELKSFLSRIAAVYEMTDLLHEVLVDPAAKAEFARFMADYYHADHRLEELLSMEPAELARVSVAGLPAYHVHLASLLKGKEYDLQPLPNMYFMRDAAMVYRGKSVSSAMRFRVRRMEALINHFVFSRHPDFTGDGCLLNGPEHVSDGFSIEGGDFQVIRKNVVAIGVSERTSASAIDSMASRMADAYGEPISIFAVELPVARATIHLDMAFTVVDNDSCLVYEPVILGQRRARVIRVDAVPDKDPILKEVPSLLAGLKGAGIDLEPVLTGGLNPVHQEREQWMSGANSFSFAPGKIIMYSCNLHTVEALSQAGFEIRQASHFIDGKEDPMSFKRLVVGFDGVELARGGGGARCMTCPIERDDA
ncbi:MAG: arginine deiminase family protein [Spirochaetota bacterium]